MSNNLWDDDQQVFRKLLRELRQNAKLTQIDLAEALGKPQSFVSKYESGERRLSYIEVRAIVHNCGSSVTCFDRQLSKFID